MKIRMKHHRYGYRYGHGWRAYRKEEKNNGKNNEIFSLKVKRFKKEKEKVLKKESKMNSSIYGKVKKNNVNIIKPSLLETKIYDEPKKFIRRGYYNSSIDNINNCINIYNKVENINNYYKKNEMKVNKILYHRYGSLQ